MQSGTEPPTCSAPWNSGSSARYIDSERGGELGVHPTLSVEGARSSCQTFLSQRFTVADGCMRTVRDSERRDGTIFSGRESGRLLHAGHTGVAIGSRNRVVLVSNIQGEGANRFGAARDRQTVAARSGKSLSSAGCQVTRLRTYSTHPTVPYWVTRFVRINPSRCMGRMMASGLATSNGYPPSQS